jgi:hypothetical protein
MVAGTAHKLEIGPDSTLALALGSTLGPALERRLGLKHKLVVGTLAPVGRCTPQLELGRLALVDKLGLERRLEQGRRLELERKLGRPVLEPGKLAAVVELELSIAVELGLGIVVLGLSIVELGLGIVELGLGTAELVLVGLESFVLVEHIVELELEQPVSFAAIVEQLAVLLELVVALEPFFVVAEREQIFESWFRVVGWLVFELQHLVTAGSSKLELERMVRKFSKAMAVVDQH